MTDVHEKLRNIISVELQIDHEKVTPTAVLVDLGMDSISALNILFAIEETFALTQIDVAEVSEIKTIADLGVVVQRMLEAQASSAAVER